MVCNHRYKIGAQPSTVDNAVDIAYKTGNLLEADELVIVHGCNAKGIMGSGVAKAIKEKYPKAFEEYRLFYEQNGLKLGQTIWVDCEKHIIVNAITQESFGKDGKRYVSYDAITSCFHDINAIGRMSQLDESNAHKPFKSIALPLIGAGLGGGDWNVISGIISEQCEDIHPVVYLIDGKIP